MFHGCETRVNDPPGLNHFAVDHCRLPGVQARVDEPSDEDSRYGEGDRSRLSGWFIPSWM